MPSPITTYKQILKECGITDELNVSTVGRMTYLQEQVGQQKAILNRLLFDATVARISKEAAKDVTLKDAHRQKEDGYLNDIRQIKSALENNLTLIDELREEYPELQVEQ